MLGILTRYPAHRAVVVAHGGVLGALLALVEGRSPNDPSAYDLLNCSLTHLHVMADRSVVHRRNDVCHLESLVELDDDAEAEACD
jgi:broad specificity phosphatase PhoE